MFKPTDDLNLTGGLRLDYDKNYDVVLLPQLNVSYAPHNYIIRGSIGKRIRAADYTERYVSNNLANLTPGRSLGNPDLLAENSWSEELGLDIYIGSKLQLKTTGFFRQSKQLIDYVSTNEAEIGDVGDLQSGAEYFFAKYITNVTTKGVELESVYQHNFVYHHSIALLMGYTRQITSNESGVISVYIANHAKDLANMSAILNLGDFNLSVAGLYKNRNQRLAQAINSKLEASYVVWNLKTGYAITDHISIDVLVQNIFDEPYQNILGAPMPGRWVSGRLGWSF
jgi:iron complex outermembrane receptor protein